jgi:putative toxin-antitoxin system antitoxin component (TIGR02293 family)
MNKISKTTLNTHSADGRETLPVIPSLNTTNFNGDKRKTGFAYWLGMPVTTVKNMVSDFDIVKLGAAGITKSSINSLASHIGISRKAIAEDIFDVSVKTLERKDSNARLDKKTSSHALEIAKVMQHAYEVFRDEEKMKVWINRENKALNNMKPVQIFDTLSGLNMVNDMLGRIEEGVYS